MLKIKYNVRLTIGSAEWLLWHLISQWLSILMAADSKGSMKAIALGQCPIDDIIADLLLLIIVYYAMTKDCLKKITDYVKCVEPVNKRQT